MDEFGHYLLAEKGYVVKDPNTEYYHYARYDSKGNVVSSAFRVGRDDLSSGVKRLAWENEENLTDRAWRLRGYELDHRATRAAGPRSGHTLPESLIVILVEFSDVKHQNEDAWPMYSPEEDPDVEELPSLILRKTEYPAYTVEDFETMLFGDNYTGMSPDGEKVYGSMRQYWQDMSKGTYTLRGRVANDRDMDSDVPVWVELGESKSYYNSHGSRHFRNAVLDSAVSQQRIDASTSNARKICIIYAGNLYINDLVPAYFSNIYTMSERWVPYWSGRVDNTERDYSNFSHIGVHCHEFGHVLGFGDKYGGSRDYYEWGLMAHGGNKAVNRRGDNPAPLAPHHRSGLGWISPKNVTRLMDDTPLSYSSGRTSYLDDVYQIGTSTDFFLIENRQPGDDVEIDSGWNLSLPEIGGLLIWHINDGPGLYGDFIGCRPRFYAAIV